MIISSYGAEFIKVSHGDTILAFNPVAKTSKLKQARFGADVALVSLEHDDMRGVEMVTHGEKQPVVVRGPGEYETRDILIKGYPTVSRYGGTELINTVYLVRMEKMTLLYLGALGTKELPAELKEALDTIDVLFVPIGGEGVLEPAPAHELAVSISPKIVIPIHYGSVGIAKALDLFLKEEGTENGNHAPIDKLTLKARELEGRENDVIVLKGV